MKQAQITLTPFRTKLTHVLKKQIKAITAKEIEQVLGENTDRVTLFRTLKLFEQKHLIHRIVYSDGIVRYKWGAADAHAHFFCTKCQAVYCIAQPVIASINLPAFTITSQQTTFSGYCNQCKKPNL